MEGVATGIMRAADETELTGDEVNDLLDGDERDAGWEADAEDEWAGEDTRDPANAMRQQT